MRGVILLLPFLALTLAGQPPPASWGNVKAISPGTEVRVERTGAPSIHGQVFTVTDDAVVVKAGKPQTLSKQEVETISVHKNGHRARNAMIGLGVGAAAGLGTGLAITHCTGGFCFSDLGRAVTAGVSVAGGVIGAVIGAVIPTGGWLPVYKK